MLSAKPRNPWPTGSTPDFVGGYTEGFADNAPNSISISLESLTGGLASAPEENDIVIVVFAANTAGALTIGVTGYTEVANIEADDSFDVNLCVAYKKMTATPDTDVTLTWATGISSGAVAVHVWRDQDLSSPFDATATTATGINTGVVNPAAISVPRAGSIILCAGASASGGYVNVTTASYLSNFITIFQNLTGDTTASIGSVVSLGGPYNPAAWTFSNDDPTCSWASVTMALKGA